MIIIRGEELIKILKKQREIISSTLFILSYTRRTCPGIFYEREDPVKVFTALNRVMNHDDEFIEIIDPEAYENITSNNFLAEFNDKYIKINEKILKIIEDNIIIYLSSVIFNKHYYMNRENTINENKVLTKRGYESMISDREVYDKLRTEEYKKYYKKIYKAVSIIKSNDIMKLIDIKPSVMVSLRYEKENKDNLLGSIIKYILNDRVLEEIVRQITSKDIRSNKEIVYNYVMNYEEEAIRYYSDKDEEHIKKIEEINNKTTYEIITGVIINIDTIMLYDDDIHKIYDIERYDYNDGRVSKEDKGEYIKINKITNEEVIKRYREYIYKKMKEIFKYEVESYYDNIVKRYIETVEIEIGRYIQNIYIKEDSEAMREIERWITERGKMTEILSKVIQIYNIPYKMVNIKKEEHDLLDIVWYPDVLVEDLDTQEIVRRQDIDHNETEYIRTVIKVLTITTIVMIIMIIIIERIKKNIRI